MRAVGNAAKAMIEEVRTQITTISELKGALEVMKRNQGTGTERSDWSKEDIKAFENADGKAEYGKCVEISTNSIINQMVIPGLLAVVIPVVTGFLGNKKMLDGLIAVVTVSGVLMSVFQAIAGGAWDNVKNV